MDIIKNAYNKICDQWDKTRKNSPVNKCIEDFAEYLKPGSKILDAGCGTGFPISAYLSNRGFSVTGIDISEKMIKKAKKLNLSDADFLVCDLLDFNTSEKYDAVIAFDSLWHISHERQEEIYCKVSSLLNNCGYFLFTHGKNNGEIFGSMFGQEFYYSALDKDTVLDLLIKNGFYIISCIENYEEKTTGDRELIIVAEKIYE